ncbi:hypothetical protein TRM7557_03014 [Tritonibacter multivorans]|uniref:DUF2852 domain-containing protein n=1 Tax=Tritonibacter multivorans TaxID=928856 RepID=A0A0P1GWJ7_9RHOB|nr:DUF2852 domain-containing protein [Tritonibacter multivorans]MDA7420852.1 DUF2852 domain-containing protein [Tritonibacter multivorans]CUH80626.1 hypothetical protein TRM7557_03014 [Tritonibacter multivorans]SFC84543.1 Protein of unknown function [Tritonibacter multivorans]
MTSYTTNAPPFPGWLASAEAWLDARGKGAWITAMVIGFIFFWPLGLLLLAYMIWSKRMFSSCARKTRGGSYSSHRSMRQSSGNSAFDAYKADTLRRLEQEQSDFEAFLGRLRDAKDKAEFDQFMDERAQSDDHDAEEAKPAS